MSPVDDCECGKSNKPVRLDLALVLKRTIEAFYHDFAGVVLGGIMLVMLPGVLSRSLAGGDDLGTLLTTLRAVAAMLYTALASWGVVSRLHGHALPPAEFVRQGLARATPGLQVALLAGVAAVIALTIHLFARHGTLAGWMLNSLLLIGALLTICVLMPLVPVAVVEGLRPMAAFRRAAALTEGNRNRILALALILLLTLAPSAALAAGFAGEAGPWIKSLFELFAWSLAATVPAVVYTGLEGALR